VGYNPEKLSEGDISARLEQAGYLGDFNFPAEVGQESYQRDAQGNFFRHTAVYETTRQVVSFSQNVNYSGRALWPCPGFGPVKMEE
jgi:phospholipase C